MKNQKIPEVTISGENLVTVHQAAKESAYILRIFPSPAVTDEDYVTARVVCDVFSDIFFGFSGKLVSCAISFVLYST